MKSKVPARRVTLAHVAARAGVSTATVSLILSGREEYIRQFRPETVSKVRDSADRLGYRTNLFASGLPNKASFFFSVILQDMGSMTASTWHHWAFEGDLLAGVIVAATQRKVYPIVANAHPKEEKSTLASLDTIIAGGVFGVIATTPSPPLERYLKSRLRNGQPVVVVFPNRLGTWPTNAMDVDNFELGRMAGEMLARCGRRKWALIWFGRKDFEPQVKRCSGFQQAAVAAGATVETIQLPRGLDDLETRDALSPRLARLGADGLFAIDSIASVGTLQACTGLGWQAGRDFNLVGCDCAFWQSINMPRITSIDVSWRDLGMTALSKLCELAGLGEARFDTMLVHPRITPAETCPVPAEWIESAPPMKVEETSGPGGAEPVNPPIQPAESGVG